MVTPVNDLMQKVTQYQYNPALIQTANFKKLSEALDGTMEVVDPTNPFVWAIESAAVLTAAAMMKCETNTRRQYPVMAQTFEDLYYHMSDTDYLNRFATPSTTKFSILLNMDEVLSKMILDTATGIKKVVIPRNSVFSIAGVYFSIQYPIEIRQLVHGGYQIVYDASITSPLFTLASNVIPFEIVQSTEGKFFMFDFDVHQFDIISKTATLDSAIDFTMDIPLNDQFYFARVFVQDASNTWVEIKTTHNDQVYDIATPTAVLKVGYNSVNVRIPQIYTATGVISRGIRIDIYETKGKLDMVLWDYPMSAFGAKWLALDPADNTDYTAAMAALTTVAPFCKKSVSGGTNALTFTELRNKVVQNAIGAPSLPITPSQAMNELSINGYSVVKNIDNVTNRVFLATKTLPSPTDPGLITPASSGISTLNTTLTDLLKINTVADNGTSATIKPDTLYRNVNGVITPLSNDQIATLLAMSNNALALEISNNDYLYTPFHYVLDMVGNELAVRPYYLDAPEVISKTFVGQNDTTLLQASTDSFNIVKTATGYLLTVITISSDSFRALLDANVFAQLSFIPEGEKDRAFINGTFAGNTSTGERIFTFDLSTNFNVDKNDFIQLTKFLMYTTQPRLTGAGLVTDFTITYSTDEPMGQQWVANQIDSMLGKVLLPQNVVGVNQETLRIKFGDALPGLWARSRSIGSSVKYKKWANDVLRIYEQDVYEPDALGSIISFSPAGALVYNKVHSKGDPVLDALGNPIYLHRAGDVMLDPTTGNPIVDVPKDILRQIDLLLIEAVYWFANDVTAANYRKAINKAMVQWITVDMVNMKAMLLENSEIYFHPSGRLGTLRAMVDQGVIANINSNQSFTVEISVPNNVFNDAALLEKLKLSTITTIRDQLANVTVTLDGMITALRNVYGSDVISFVLKGLGGSNGYTVITSLEDAKRCSIKKRLTASADNALIVEEDVIVTPVLYKTN